MTTVETVFKILDRASPALDRMDRKAKALDRTLDRIGKRMDEFAARSERDMRIAEQSNTKYARAAERNAGKVTAAYEGMSRGIAHAVHRSERDLAGLQAQMAAMDAQRVSPSVDVDVAKAIADLKMLEAEIDRVNAKSINIGSGAARVAATGGSTGRKPGGLRSFGSEVWAAFKSGFLRQAEQESANAVQRLVAKWRNRKDASAAEQIEEVQREYVRLSNAVGRSRGFFGSAGERIASWTKIILAAGPAVEALVAATSGLLGSLGGGILGAGAGLTGLLGTATVGMGGFLGVLLPTIGRIKEAAKAQEAYNKAVEKYGKNSEQAVKAQRLFERSGTPGARRLLGVWSNTKSWWQRRTKRGQEATLGLMSDFLSRGKAMFGEQAAEISNTAAVAARAGNNEFLNTLDSPTTHRNLNILSKLFNNLSPAIGRILANLSRVFLNLAAAAQPQVTEFIQWLDRWMSNANKDTSGLAKVQEHFKQWTTDLKVWINFIKQTFKLMGAFFGRGQKSGNALLNEASHQMREWREAIEAKPKGVENWFDKQTDNFKRLFREVGALVGGLSEMVDILSELIKPITDINQFLRNIFGGGAGGMLGAAAAWGAGLKAAKGLGRGAATWAGKTLMNRGPIGEWLGEKVLKMGGWGVKGATPQEPLWVRIVGGGREGPGGVVVGSKGGKGGATPTSRGQRFKNFFGAAGKFLGWASATTGLLTLAQGGDVNEAVHAADPGNILNLFGMESPLSASGPLGELSGSKGWGNLGRILNPFDDKSKKFGELKIRPNVLQKFREEREKLGKAGGEGLVQGQKKAIESGTRDVASATKRQWEATHRAQRTPLRKMLNETGLAYDSMWRQASGHLQAMGYTPQQARSILRGGGGGGRGKFASGIERGELAGPPTPRTRRQGGGFIGGRGMQDTVPFGNAMVAPGEAWIATRHHQATINRLLPPGVTLRNIIEGDKRPHSSPMRRQGGGMAQIPTLAAQLGLHAGEGPGQATPGVHTAGSLHYAGLAYDISGPPAAMLQFRKMAETRWLGRGLNELFYDPYPYYIDQGRKVPGAIGNHSDHVHIGFFPGGPTGANVSGMLRALGPAGTFKAVRAPKSKQRGVPGALAQAIMDAYASGLNRRMRGAAGMGMAAAGMVPLKGVDGGPVPQQMIRWLLGHGWSRVGAAGIMGNAFAESSWNPLAMEPGTDNGGLFGFTAGEKSMAALRAFAARMNAPWQAVPTQMAFMESTVSPSLRAAMNNARSAAEAALIFMNEWERPGIPRAEVRTAAAQKALAMMGGMGRQSGGLVDFAGWHRRGGRFRVDRPTLFGAGDGPGAETVTVSSGGGAGGGRKRMRGGPLVNIEKIEWKREGDVEEAIQREFAKIGQALDAFVDDEDELL